MKKRHVMVVVSALTVMMLTGCSGEIKRASDSSMTASSSAVSEERGGVSDTDGTLIDYEKIGALTLGKYQGIELKKKDLQDEDLTEEQMAAELAWDRVVSDSDASEVQQSLIDEEYKNTKMQYESMAEMLGTTLEDTMSQFGVDEEGMEEISRDQVVLRMIAKTIMVKENLTLSDEDYIKYLQGFMDESGVSTKEELEELYKNDYGTRPKDDMYIELVRDYVGSKAEIK